MTQRFVELPVSKAVLDVATISFIGQTNLNEYNVFFNYQATAFPKIDGVDRDALLKAMNVERLPKPAPEAEAPAHGKVVLVGK